VLVAIKSHCTLPCTPTITTSSSAHPSTITHLEHTPPLPLPRPPKHPLPQVPS
jgi:hypothetical protein